MSSISTGRKALVLKRLSKIDKIITMVKRVKGLDPSVITTAVDVVRDQLDEIPLKGAKGKPAAAKKVVKSDLI